MLRIIIVTLATLLLVSCAKQVVLTAAVPNNSIPTCAVSNLRVGQNIILNAYRPAPGVYLIHNTSSKSFWLNHLSKRPMNAGWASSIAPDHWSAILVDQPNFTMNCSIISDPQKQTLNCADVAQVCLLATKPIERGNHYWVAEDQTKAAILPAIQKRGL